MSTGWILREMNPADLKNHKVNIEIYGTQSIDSDMLASVKELGVLEPIRSTKDCVILSGHRRRQHAVAGKCKTVPVLVARHAISDAEQVIEIVESNRQREKTMEQKAREYSKLSEAKSELARKRMVSGKKSDPTSKLTEGQKGEAKSQAAKEVGMSRNTAEQAKEVVEVIDKKAAAGDAKGAADLREKLNTGSVAAAHRAAKPETKKPDPPKKLGEFDDETIDDLLDQLIIAVNDRAEKLDARNSGHQACIADLRVFSQSWKAWRKS